ncbi:MAG TPA: MGMT family protein [Actinocrinis sp.]|nr:MGMT family protein [Actinocrinis sp.]
MKTSTTGYAFHSMTIEAEGFAGLPFAVLTEGDVVRASGFTEDPAMLAGLAKVDLAEVGPGGPDHPALVSAARYFAGDLLALDGVDAAEAVAPSPFRQAARDALRKIPAGETRTYTQLAVAAGNPAAVRAAASGCATNPLTLFVPCHRVLRTDGSLGGFLFGVELKARLLDHERAASE